MSQAHVALRTFLFSCSAIAVSVHAQERTVPEAASGEVLAEVVVTAEKRDATVQSTPLSITAISGEQLRSQGLTNVKAVAAETPGISFRSAGPGQTEFEMRGLPSSGGSSPTVGFYVNEAALTAPAAALNGKVTIDPDLYDLNRIEVLRGPQGTLYGASSMGGTIKLVTNRPVLGKFEGSAQTIFSDTDGGGFNYGGNGMVNLPLGEKAALRLVGTYKYTDGFIDYDVLDPFPIGPNDGSCIFGSCVRGDVTRAPVRQRSENANDQRLSGGRAALRMQPSDSLSIDVTAMHQQIRMGGFSQVDLPPGPDVALAHYQPFATTEPYEDRFTLLSGEIGYDLGFAQLTSASSYWKRESSFTGDNSEALQSLLSAFFGLTDMLEAPYNETDQTNQLSQELRLTSSGDGAWQWLGGLYFSRFHSTWKQYVANPAYAAISVPLEPDGDPVDANPLGIEYQSNNPYRIKQYAVFGETSYKMTEHLKATVGLRWYKYESALDYEQSGLFGPSGNATPVGGQVAASDRGTNPKFNLSYQPTPDLTLYTTAARGFRPGGVNIPVPESVCATQVSLTYDPDTLWNYEIGEKARFFDRRLIVNADLFYIRWNGVQQYLNLACGYPYTVNAGRARSYGAELELTALLTESLSLSVGGAYADARITSVNPDLAGQTVGPTKVLTEGMVLQNVPRYTANASLSYTRSLSGDWGLRARIAALRIGPQYDLSYLYTQLPAYSLANARIGLTHARLSASLFVDNITDKHAITTINNTSYSVSVPSLTRASITTPRTVGVDLSYSF